MRLAIVTPDLIGPIKNGGIGTYATNLASLWAEAGHDVTVVFTGVPEVGSDWEGAYTRKGIQVRQLTWSLNRQFTDSLVQDWFYARSEEVRNILSECSYDSINFQDWQASGLVTLQARRSGLAFGATACSLTVHSPTRWGGAGQKRWPRNPMIDSRVDEAERWCIEAADHVYFPSRHMQSYVEAQGWQPRVSTLMHYPLLGSRAAVDERRQTAEKPRLAFFGRLETRKGLELFCEAVALLPPEEKSLLGDVLFLGKPGQTKTTLLGDAYARNAMAAAGVACTILSDLDSEGALGKLAEVGAIAVMPSLLDNLPFAALECLARQIPMIASNVGGLAELLPNESLFELDSAELSSLLASIVRGRPVVAATFDQIAANARWAQSAATLKSAPASSPLATKVDSTVSLEQHGRLVAERVSWSSAAEVCAAVLVRDVEAIVDDVQRGHLIDGYVSGDGNDGCLVVVGRETHGSSEVWPVEGSITTQLTRESVDAAALAGEAIFNTVWPTISSTDCIASFVLACQAVGVRRVCVPTTVARLNAPHTHSFDSRVRDVERIEALLPQQLKGMAARLTYPLVLDGRLKRLPDGSVWYTIDEMLARVLPLASRRRHSALVVAGRLKRLVGAGSYG